jgi:hypothetical protein
MGLLAAMNYRVSQGIYNFAYVLLVLRHEAICFASVGVLRYKLCDCSIGILIKGPFGLRRFHGGRISTMVELSNLLFFGLPCIRPTRGFQMKADEFSPYLFCTTRFPVGNL